jgi:hypothetical protein
VGNIGRDCTWARPLNSHVSDAFDFSQRRNNDKMARFHESHQQSNRAEHCTASVLPFGFHLDDFNAAGREGKFAEVNESIFPMPFAFVHANEMPLEIIQYSELFYRNGMHVLPE